MRKRKIKKRLKKATRLLKEMRLNSALNGIHVPTEVCQFIESTCGKFDWKLHRRPESFRTTSDTPNDGNVGKAEEIPA